MGKQLGVIQYSGKLGQVVGMKKANGQRYNNVRERVTPSNPQSNAQADQRMKLNVANMMYRAIEPVLSRSWQNKHYGQESRNFFMSQVLKSGLETEGGWLPFVEKGVYNPVPAEVPVSVGSIAVDTTVAFEPTNMTPYVTFYGRSDSLPQVIETAKYNGLEDGDQITIIACFDTGRLQGDAPTNLYIWRYDSIIFKEDATDLEDLKYGVRSILYLDPDTTLGYCIKDSATDNIPSAAAVIISREKSEDAGKAGLRTTSKMFVNNEVKAVWGTASQYGRARRSYQKQVTAESDWEVDAEGSGVDPRETVDSTYTLVAGDFPTGEGGGWVGQQIKVKRYVDDESIAYVYAKGSSDTERPVSPIGGDIEYTDQMVVHTCYFTSFQRDAAILNYPRIQYA